MKLNILSSPLRTLSVVLLCAGAFSSSAHSDVIAQFDMSTYTSSGGPRPAADWADNTFEPTNFAPGAGSGITSMPSAFPSYNNLPTAITLTQYVGTTISAEAGYQLNLTDFVFQTGGSVGPFFAPDWEPSTAYAWGYRINEGSGFGEWQMGTTYTRSDADYSDKTTYKTWDFADFSTTGTVEFGLFGAGDVNVSNPAYIEARSFTVNGTVTQAVPEPSTVALGIIGTAVLAVIAIRNRRRSAVSAA